jgi:hypothetical protein
MRPSSTWFLKWPFRWFPKRKKSSFPYFCWNPDSDLALYVQATCTCIWIKTFIIISTTLELRLIPFYSLYHICVAEIPLPGLLFCMINYISLIIHNTCTDACIWCSYATLIILTRKRLSRLKLNMAMRRQIKIKMFMSTALRSEM